MFTIREEIAADLDRIRSGGLYKAERPITTAQSAHIATDLGECLNLTDENALKEVAAAYQALHDMCAADSMPMPQNTPGHARDQDLLKRHLDCAVIEMLHALREDQNLARYHTVRAPFWEGPRLYPHAGFCQETHVQICVRDTACIKGYFRPLRPDGAPFQP